MSDTQRDSEMEGRERDRPRQGQKPKTQALARDELPEAVYRLKTLHSCETFFGYFEPSGAEWPHFRTMAELELLLEGPFAAAASEAETQDPESMQSAASVADSPTADSPAAENSAP